MKTVYLAGGLTRPTSGQNLNWWAHARQLLNCPTIEPAFRDHRPDEQEEFVEIVKKEKSNIDSCDILLGNYTEPSIETSLKALYAWERGKIVVLVASSSQELSAWLLYHHHKLFFGLEEAASYINSRLLREMDSSET